MLIKILSLHKFKTSSKEGIFSLPTKVCNSRNSLKVYFLTEPWPFVVSETSPLFPPWITTGILSEVNHISNSIESTSNSITLLNADKIFSGSSLLTPLWDSI